MGRDRLHGRPLPGDASPPPKCALAILLVLIALCGCFDPGEEGWIGICGGQPGTSFDFLMAAGEQVAIVVDGGAACGPIELHIEDVGCPDNDDDGWTTCGGDCDDLYPLAYPGAPELCGYGLDEDGDGTVDEGYTCPVYVDDDAVGPADGSWTAPYDEISLAVASRPFGCDRIHVLDGTYSPFALINEDLRIVGLLGPDETYIDAGDPDPSFDDIVDGTRNDMGAYGGPYGSWP